MLISLPALCRAIFKVEEVILSIFTFLNEVGVQIQLKWVCFGMHGGRRGVNMGGGTPYRVGVFLDCFLEFLEGV